MLKDATAILAMLREQEEALQQEKESSKNRNYAIIAAMNEASQEFAVQLDAMLNNVRLAIRKIEGPQEVDHG